MSFLLKEIQRIDPYAAQALKQAKFYSDSDIQTLTRQDLHELFPKPENLRLRRTIYETIHKQKPIHTLLKELQNFIPCDDFRAALNNNGVLVDYLHILKDMKTQLNNVQSFLDAHVGLLEDLSISQPVKQLDQVSGVLGGGHSDMQKSNLRGTPSSASASTGGFLSSIFGYNQTEKTNVKDVRAKESDRSPASFYGHKKQVNYKMVVSGRTFGAHRQILERVQVSSQLLNLVNMDENQTSEVCHVTFVFCPVVSRVGTDVEAALKEVKGSGPVILVLMHHSHEAKHVSSFKTWEDDSNILFYDNIFYHEKANGIIACKENNDAISAIQNKLLICFNR